MKGSESRLPFSSAQRFNPRRRLLLQLVDKKVRKCNNSEVKWKWTYLVAALCAFSPWIIRSMYGRCDFEAWWNDSAMMLTPMGFATNGVYDWLRVGFRDMPRNTGKVIGVTAIMGVAVLLIMVFASMFWATISLTPAQRASSSIKMPWGSIPSWTISLFLLSILLRSNVKHLDEDCQVRF